MADFPSAFERIRGYVKYSVAIRELKIKGLFSRLGYVTEIDPIRIKLLVGGLFFKHPIGQTQTDDLDRCLNGELIRHLLHEKVCQLRGLGIGPRLESLVHPVFVDLVCHKVKGGEMNEPADTGRLCGIQQIEGAPVRKIENVLFIAAIGRQNAAMKDDLDAVQKFAFTLQLSQIEKPSVGGFRFRVCGYDLMISGNPFRDRCGKWCIGTGDENLHAASNPRFGLGNQTCSVDRGVSNE